MKKLLGPIIGLHFMRHKSVVIDTTHGLIHFTHLTMETKNAAIEKSAKPQPLLIQDNTTVMPMTTKTITAFVDHPSERHTTGTVTPVGMFTEAASLLKSPSISTIFDKKAAVVITNTTESPYLIKKNTQTAKFSVVTPEQSKFIRPVDTTILSMIPEGDPDLTNYLSELLRKNKPEQQSKTFWFPTPKNPGKTEDHTPIQTRIPKKLRELQKKEKLNPEHEVESRMKFWKRFDWTDTLLSKISWSSTMMYLTDTEGTLEWTRSLKSDSHRKMTTLFTAKAYRCRSTWKNSYLLNYPLFTNMGLSQSYPSQNMQVLYLHRAKPNAKLRLLLELKKINTLIADDYTNNTHPVNTFSDAAQHLAGKSLFCKVDCIQAYHCLQMADQRSVEMLAFTFARRTIAYRRLAQCLSRSVSAFSSFMREYLDPVV